MGVVSSLDDDAYLPIGKKVSPDVKPKGKKSKKIIK